MTATALDLTATPTWRELTNVIARLDLVSHGTTQSFTGTRGTSADDDIGGRRPAGGISDDHRRDYEHGTPPDPVMLRSADHFRHRAQGCRTEPQLAAVLHDAQAALRSWQHTPRTTDPEPGSWAWREQIARDIATGKRTRGQAMKHYSISRTTLWRILKTYAPHLAEKRTRLTVTKAQSSERDA